MKVGIYSDSAGIPTTRLDTVGSTAVVSGWNTITFPSVSIVSGTAYWLATNSSVFDLVSGITNGTGVDRYKALTYTDPFPNPAGGGYDVVDWLMLEAGWGTLSTGGARRRIIN
jgi:hypothetical protein